MNLFFPYHFYKSKNRGHLFPLLKPFIKHENFSDKERIDLYNLSEKDFFFTEELAKADIVILPMSWNFYVRNGDSQKVLQYIKNLEKLSKQVWLFMADDFGLDFPDLSNCKIFRLNGYRSRHSYKHIGIPAFINDPLRDHFNSSRIIKRQYSDSPVVGFCGLANNSLPNIFKEFIKVAYRNLKYALNFSPFQKEQLISPSYLRRQCLDYIEKDAHIKTNFVVRKQYRAGAVTEEERIKTAKEFFDNMKDSDYILCVRGAGNFSVRLYETLAMGRIPVFLNTDCILPLIDEIEWKDHVVWVEFNQRHLISEKIVEFHNKLTESEFHNVLESNRKLWEDKLRLGSFFKHILRQ